MRKLDGKGGGGTRRSRPSASTATYLARVDLLVFDDPCDFENKLQALTAAKAERDAAQLARRHADPNASGTYEWSKAGYTRGNGCEMWQAQRLRIRIEDDGQASWSALINSDGRCAEGVFVPANCGQDGAGFLEKSEGVLTLVTTRRGRFGGVGAPAVSSVWQCGGLKVRAPLAWKPSRDGQCTRLGSAADPGVERASELACQYSQIFPEFTDPGVKIAVSKDGLSFTHDGQRLKATRIPQTESQTAQALPSSRQHHPRRPTSEVVT